MSADPATAAAVIFGILVLVGGVIVFILVYSLITRLLQAILRTADATEATARELERIGKVINWMAELAYETQGNGGKPIPRTAKATGGVD